MIVSLTFAPIIVGCVLQLNFYYFSEQLPGYPTILKLVLLLTVSAVLAGRVFSPSVSGLSYGCVTPFACITGLLTLYVLFQAAFLGRIPPFDSLLLYLTSTLVAIHFKDLFARLPIRRHPVLTLLMWLVLVSVLSHLLQAQSLFLSQFDGSPSSSRYGFVNGRQIINITAINICFAIIATVVISIVSNSVWHRLLGAMILFVGLVPLAATGSRSAFLILAVFFAIAFVTLQRRVDSSKARYGALFWIVGSAAFVAALTQLAGFLERVAFLMTRLSSFGTDEPIRVRIENLEAAVNHSAVLFGVSADSGAFLGRAADNMIAEILISHGIVGLALYVASIVFFAVMVFGLFSRATALFFAIVLIEGSSEGFFVTQSSLFTFLCMIASVAIWSARIERRICPSLASIRIGKQLTARSIKT